MSSRPSSPEPKGIEVICSTKASDGKDVEQEQLTPPQNSWNPVVESDDEDNAEHLERIRGDAIGDTLYSERFVLSTVLKLANIEKQLAEDEKFESELCALWDMTIEEDVVKLLLQHNCLELFAQCIDETTDKRLTEILVGMIGNMCNLEKARNSLYCNADVLMALLTLISCSDSLTLIQLMRLLSVLLIYDNTEDTDAAAAVWFKNFNAVPDFIQNFCFILSNATNTTLLANALEALNAILAKLAPTEDQHENNAASLEYFCDVFVDESFVKSTSEAFMTVVPALAKRKKHASGATADEAFLPSQNTRKTMQIFLNIHGILAQYEEISCASYSPHMKQFMCCLNRILEPLCEPVCLLPLTIFEQEVVESVNDIFMALKDPVNEVCIAQMMTIWNIVTQDKKRRAENELPPKEFGDEPEQNDEINVAEFCQIILDYLKRSVNRATTAQLIKSLSLLSKNIVVNYLSTFTTSSSTDDTNVCYAKIKSAFDKLPEMEKSKV